MKRERGQALILVLILLVVGVLVTVPVLQLVSTNLKARGMYGQFIKEDYAADAAIEYALWKLRYEEGYAANLTFGVSSDPLYVTVNGVTANATITAEATEMMSGYGLIDHQIKPTKTVDPPTTLPGVATTFTYTITLERLEPDDAVFIPLQSIKDGTDEGFVYVPGSSVLDGVPFDDNDLTILQEPVIITPQSELVWGTTADKDSMVSQVSPTQNYGSELMMDVSSGLPSSNVTARSFLKFDISNIPGEGIVIQYATLTLWAESYPTVIRTYDLHQVTDNWTETSINWNNQPAVAANTTDSAKTASVNGTPMEWNVLADVQDWWDGITPNYGWCVSDHTEEIGTESYTVTVSDTLEFELLKGRTPDVIPIAGDIYAIAYASEGDNGTVKTVEITPGGDITDTVIDTLLFDAVKGKTPSIIPIAGDIYAVAYAGEDDDGFLKTVKIQSTGNIPNVVDTLEFDTDAGKTPDIIPIAGDVYAIAYAGDGDDGFLKTVQIAANGQITDTVIDTLEFDTLAGKTPNIIPISGDIYAIAYAGDGDDGFLKTVEITSGGTITDTVINTLEFDTLAGKTPKIIPISGNIYAIAYAGDGDDGFLKTVQIASNGQIAGAVIDTLEFDTDKGKTPSITHVSGNAYAIAYTGTDDDGFLKAVVIIDDGYIIETATNTPEFDTLKGNTPNIIHISGDVYAIAYSGDSDNGFLKTVDLVQGSGINHTTEFYTRENCAAEAEPTLVVGYTPLGGTAFQTIEWIFEPDLDFYYGQERTLSFQTSAILDDNTRYWNAVVIQPNKSYTGMTANVTVGNPPDTEIPGAGATVTKSADPHVVYAGIPTIVTYVISITNSDIGEFSKLDYIEDYLPPGFSYVVGSATLEWEDHNSTDNPAYQTYGWYYNIGDFEPDFKDDPSGRLKLKWHKKASANELFPGDDELLHDRPFPAGVTYTQTFQALASVNVSGSYPNEVFVKLKDWNLYGDRGLGDLKEIYSWPTGEVVVPAYDILTETQRSTLRANAAIIQDEIVVRSWHWKKHK